MDTLRTSLEIHRSIQEARRAAKAVAATLFMGIDELLTTSSRVMDAGYPEVAGRTTDAVLDTYFPHAVAQVEVVSRLGEVMAQQWDLVSTANRGNA